MKHTIYCFLFTICFFSCNNTGKENAVLNGIDNLIEQDPDSALQILDSLQIDPGDQWNYHLFILYLVKCKDKIGKDISKDREIVEGYNYFKENNEEYYAGLSAYYSGRVLQKNKEYDKAISYYNIARNYASKNNDNDFNAIILYSEGEVMLNQLLIDDAKIKFITANELFRQTGNYKYGIKIFEGIASTYLYNSEYDSSLVYFNKALKIADTYDDNSERAGITKDKAIVYYGKNDMKTALMLVNEAKTIDSSIIVTGKADVTLSSIYLGKNQLDSARYCAKNALSLVNENDPENANTLIGIYLLLSEIEERAGNYNRSLDFHKSYSDYLLAEFSEDNANTIINIERKYKYELAQNEINRLLLKHLEKQRVIYLLLLIISIITIIYYRQVLKKNKQLTGANFEILELTDSIKELELTRADSNNTKESIADYCAHSFSILKKVAGLQYAVLGNKNITALVKEFNRVAYGQDQIHWDTLYRIINTQYDGFFDRLKDTYPELNESEFRICCLVCSKMSSKEIAPVMQLSVNTINVKETNIRKKLGIKRRGGISDFLFDSVK
ncbi:MAG TPA: LuxR C-terminal-related transcriptional regulator [Dysgonomonas sp.]|uniref:tetratricopeptide repeat protein n=1 Tax=unclassified Dysgonomonas TaxID=2630389 RepID=UPI0025C0E641|nr:MULTISPECIES: LuxR C-terminal-related transcriptional regulator [unclassified Dysgonomonas]HML65282.1 LuxR C-terminal-related transcriptional regulator [Dysgonomonas sp.]